MKDVSKEQKLHASYRANKLFVLKIEHLWEKCTYIQGKKDGKYENWYKNGKPFIKRTYIQGKQDGKYERWFKNGNICEEITYSEGKQIF